MSGMTSVSGTELAEQTAPFKQWETGIIMRLPGGLSKSVHSLSKRSVVMDRLAVANIVVSTAVLDGIG